MRWNTYSDYLRKKYGQNVFRIGVDAGFSCPNRRKDRMGENHLALPSRFLEEIPQSLFTEDEGLVAENQEDRIGMLNDLLGKYGF